MGHLNGVLREKLETMTEAVEREFGHAAECWAPKGGIFLWIKLPAEVDVRKLIKPAADAGIVFNAGPDWAVSAHNSSNCLRLCFAMPRQADHKGWRRGVGPRVLRTDRHSAAKRQRPALGGGRHQDCATAVAR